MSGLREQSVGRCMCRGGPAGRNINESSNASEEVLQLSSGALGVNVSTQTGRLLSLTSNAGLLSASLNAEVCHLAHTAEAEASRRLQCL